MVLLARRTVTVTWEQKFIHLHNGCALIKYVFGNQLCHLPIKIKCVCRYYMICTYTVFDLSFSVNITNYLATELYELLFLIQRCVYKWLCCLLKRWPPYFLLKIKLIIYIRQVCAKIWIRQRYVTIKLLTRLVFRI